MVFLAAKLQQKKAPHQIFLPKNIVLKSVIWLICNVLFVGCIYHENCV